MDHKNIHKSASAPNARESKPGFWSRFWRRLKNFTAESPKDVVVENGVERLVSRLPKPSVRPETPVIREVVKRPVSVPQEAVVPEKIVKEKPIGKPVSQGALLEEVVKKPAPAPKEAIPKEKPPEKPVPPPAKAVVVEKPVEKPSPVTREAVREEIAKKPPVAPKEAVPKEKAPEKPVPPPAKAVVVEKPVEKPSPVVREAVREEIAKKPPVAPKEAVPKEKPPEKPVPPPVEVRVAEKPAAQPVEKPAPVPPQVVVTEKPVEKPVSAPPVIEEKVEKKPAPSSEKLKKGLEKTRGRFWSRLKGFISFRRKIDESALEELEDILIGADIGAKPVQKLIHEIHEAWTAKTITETSQIYDFIKTRLKEDLRAWQTDIRFAPKAPTIIMVVGVNGVGKTTAIAKLANLLIKSGKKVMVAAGDTFRAAAVDQLDIWSKRIGADIVKHQTGSDPAAVAYDAIEAAIARGTDVVIVDTAGRLHTHENLMNELSKIKRVISKKIPEAPHEVLMVLDATTGQNAVSQAKMFKQAVDVTGIFLAKLDGTAKGGIVLGMRNEVDIPVKFVGLGETADDIEQFNPEIFVNALFE